MFSIKSIIIDTVKQTVINILYQDMTMSYLAGKFYFKFFVTTYFQCTVVSAYITVL